MALRIIAKKRFLNSFRKITAYLSQEWSKKVTEEFFIIVFDKIDLISELPNIGTLTAKKNIRSVVVGKGHQNKLYYRVEKNKLIIINIKDARRNPKRNHYNA